jgi:hypothetical protein
MMQSSYARFQSQLPASKATLPAYLLLSLLLALLP